MSVLGMFRRVSSRVLDEVRAHPDRIKQVLYPQTTETAIDDDVRIDVDEAWHGIHFLLTGSATAGKPPLDFILGGAPVGDIVLGEGPARSFSSAEVRRIAAALALLDATTLRGRFDPAQMMALAIYPQTWDRPPGKTNTIEYLLENFAALKDFVTTTAQAEAGMIIYMI